MATGTVTKVQIANLALSMIGAKNITTFGETTSEEGKRINAVYSFILDEVLAEHPMIYLLVIRDYLHDDKIVVLSDTAPQTINNALDYLSVSERAVKFDAETGTGKYRTTDDVIEREFTIKHVALIPAG